MNKTITDATSHTHAPPWHFSECYIFVDNQMNSTVAKSEQDYCRGGMILEGWGLIDFHPKFLTKVIILANQKGQSRQSKLESKLLSNYT